MGDPACWLGATCLSCGHFVEPDHEDERCPQCGRFLDGREPSAATVPGVVQLLPETGSDQPEIDGD